MVENQFKEYTDHLASVLAKKNKAYGDSFTKSVNTYGLPVIGIRLSDKYNRLEHLITNDELKENDESLEDTLWDMAGYSILALKYLDSKKIEEMAVSGSSKKDRQIGYAIGRLMDRYRKSRNLGNNNKDKLNKISEGTAMANLETSQADLISETQNTND